jgi:methylmalonyl-CoA/ethylmalonyl-CoA epimerase
MNPTYIEHIGIAVKDLQKAIQLYEHLLGMPCYAVEEVADQRVRTAFQVGQTKIELLKPHRRMDRSGGLSKRRAKGSITLPLRWRIYPVRCSRCEPQECSLIDAQPRRAEGLSIHVPPSEIHDGCADGTLLPPLSYESDTTEKEPWKQ